MENNIGIIHLIPILSQWKLDREYSEIQKFIKKWIKNKWIFQKTDGR